VAQDCDEPLQCAIRGGNPGRVQQKFPEKAGEIPADRGLENPTAALVSQDKGGLGRINAHWRCWAPEGIRPNAPGRTVRASVYVYAADMALGKRICRGVFSEQPLGRSGSIPKVAHTSSLHGRSLGIAWSVLPKKGPDDQFLS